MINRITQLFGIEKPIIQGGMVWCSGWKLATAVSNAGGLGLIGAGSMHPDTFQEHIQKAKAACKKPFGVNVPLLYPEMDKIMDIIVKEGIKIVFTSAGSPKKWTPFLKKHGITVVHVVSSAFFAKKCEDAGVDAIVAEGFEAGGHNGREETTTLALIPNVRKVTSLPLIAAGGIGCGKSILAALSLGADGVQIGTRFAASTESSSHINFKEAIVKLDEGGTKLALKKLAPTRLIKNKFFDQVNEAECRGASPEEMKELLGKGRSKKGIFEGDLEEGELEIGQVGAMVKSIQPVAQIMEEMMTEYKQELAILQSVQSKYQF
ncbi:enoyl-[acyl-carrier protein] reductase II [Ancylomarina subtilis]|uniref:Enoyl-[acyl-carrier protein] reductase II n=1 Tax=Ancylomarina subtilis TaxID=1639035 RepID=A0A4Q7VC75_9BACT|nr:nitronate monooxygenase [Ancylomarina subtilis]RZT93250.1 enoyl-[acyl-carrier protein] reductase II [Ancylomarina subtilis]